MADPATEDATLPPRLIKYQPPRASVCPQPKPLPVGVTGRNIEDTKPLSPHLYPKHPKTAPRPVPPPQGSIRWEGATRSTLASPLGELTYICGTNTHDIQNATGRHRPITTTDRKDKKGHGDACPEGNIQTHVEATHRSHDYAGENTQRIPTKSRNDTRAHGVAPVQTPTNASVVIDAVNKLRMEAVEAAGNERAPTTQGARKCSPGLPRGTVLWEEPHGAMGIGAHDEFRGGRGTRRSRYTSQGRPV
jgi:hypothetical protein